MLVVGLYLNCVAVKLQVITNEFEGCPFKFVVFAYRVVMIVLEQHRQATDVKQDKGSL